MASLAVPLLLALAARGAAGAPAPLAFPASWGKPPGIQTMDLRTLPGGYGRGSSTLASWISGRMREDAERGEAQFPPAFGEPPRKQTRDLRKLPFGYGFGSGTVAEWLDRKAREVYGEQEGSSELPKLPLRRRPPVHAAKPKSATKKAAPPPPKFPKSWGPVPKAQSRDYVPLAGGYGHGSGTVSKWILSHIEQDRQAGKLQFPPAFGQPPMIETMDYRPLPFGYGHGSSTMAKWLQRQAEEVYGEGAAEYSGFHGDLRLPERRNANKPLTDSTFSI